ncbi:MAG TPA: HAD family hydrolase [Polyangia bacterium]|nr:HAD family hydrolase [Polyangia bacterium]
MHYHALACDYDGTLAPEGTILPETRAALQRLRDTGRHVLLVTGRRLEDLQQVCPDLSVFDAIVSENGAVYTKPSVPTPRLLAPAPPQAFFDRLRARGVTPLDRGGVIVATVQPHETEVMDAIRELGLELQVIFNKGAVMVLPSGVNKASGLEFALTDLGLSRHEVVGVGDGENDHAFLAHCELSVAVADAVPSLAEAADIVTRGGAGVGVVQLVDALIAGDARVLTPRRPRHQIPLGTRDDATSFAVPARDGTILCVGGDDAARSALLTHVLRRLADESYQSCVIDPAGVHGADATGKDAAVTVILGVPDRAPTIAEVVAALAAPGRHVVASLAALPPGEQPGFAAQLVAALSELRERTGRPHFLVVDRAELVWTRDSLPDGVPDGLVVATAAPDRLPPRLLAAVSLVLSAGPGAAAGLQAAAAPLSRQAPDAREVDLSPGEALAWPMAGKAPPFRLRIARDTPAS